MTLQTQNGMYVIPVFLVLAIAISAIVGFEERNATLWGLREEAGSLAIGLAEFIGAEGFAILTEGSPEDETTQEVLRPVRGILRWERAKRIFAVAEGSTPLLFDVGAWAGDSTGANAAGPASDEPPGPVDLRVVDRPPRGRIMQAAAPVLDPSGRALGHVCVETDASALDRQRREWIRDSVFRLVTALAVGLACSAILSWVLRSRIRYLGLAVEAAAGGNYDTELSPHFGLIRETSDLANTFSTMMSIVRGIVSRSRRNLLGVERFRTDEDMARAIDANCWRPKQLSQDGFVVLIRSVGRLPAGSFFDVFCVGDRVYVPFGRVQPGTALGAALAGSAVLSLLRQLLARDSMEAIAPEVSRLCDIQELTVLEWFGSDPRLLVHRLDSRTYTSDAVDAVETGLFTKAFHNLGEEADTRIRLFLKAFPSMSPGDLMEELMMLVSVIQPMPSGVLTVMSLE